MIEKRNGQFCTVHCEGEDAGKVIKCFETRKEAEAQHSAIMSSKSVKKIEINLSKL